MIGFVIGGMVIVSVVLYCCIRVGALGDCRLEEWSRKGNQDAGGESG